MKNIINIVGSILLIFILIGLWKVTNNYCYVSFLVPFVILVTIGSSFIDMKIQERTCFAECYLTQKSWLALLLTGKAFIVLFFLIFSIFITASILYEALKYEYTMYPYLILYIVIISLFYKMIVKMLKNTVSHKYLLLISREITILVSTVLSIVVYAYIVFHSPLPEYLRSDFLETIRNATNLVNSQCVFTDYVLRLKSELDGSLWWIVKSATDNIDGELIKFLIYGWIILLNSLILFGINRFIMQIIYLSEKYKGK